MARRPPVSQHDGQSAVVVRWCWRYGLPAVLVGILIASAVAIMQVLQPYQRELAIRREIVLHGGDASVEYVGPEWLRGYVREGDFEVTVYAAYGFNRNGSEVVALLEGLPRLETIVLLETDVSDADVTKLAAFKNLTWLELGGTLVTDAGLAQLQRLPRLEHLGLSGTPISDRGLPYFKQMNHLRTLDLRDTALTAEKVDKLRHAMPNVKIEWTPSTRE